MSLLLKQVLAALALFGVAFWSVEFITGPTCMGVPAQVSASPATADVGSTVSFTASAKCKWGAVAEYQWWQMPPGGSWTMVRDWDTMADFTWSTAGQASGSYAWQVWVRARGSATANETYGAATYVLKGGCVGAPVTAAASPPTARIGATVSFTASATCEGSGIPEYQWWVLPPGGSWTMVRDWDTMADFAWGTAGQAPGQYAWQVWVRTRGSAAPNETYGATAHVLS